jgi:ferredoxin-NADP reductase/ferredoxin
VGSDEDVLTAGLRQGIDLRYGCRRGKCTSCKYLVVEGDVFHDGASPYAFSPRELEEGAVLLCSTFARSHLVIRPWGEHRVEADGFEVIPPEERSARLVSLQRVTPELVELKLHLTSPLRFRAGQYVEIELPGGQERRSYSITTPPSAPADLAFLVDLRHRAMLMPFARLVPGAVVNLLGPFGNLFLRPSDRTVLMVAMGAGVAPLRAILRELRDTLGATPNPGLDRLPAIRFYCGAAPGGIPCLSEFEDLARETDRFAFVPVEVDAGAPAASRLGAVVRRIGREVADCSGHDAYVAGAPRLCDAVEALLVAKGLPETRLFVEKFYTVTS